MGKNLAIGFKNASSQSFLNSSPFRALADIILKSGYKLSIRGRCATGDDASLALFIQSRRLVVIYTLGSDGAPLSAEQLLFSLAHEVRHLQHVELGLYPRYYPKPSAGKASQTRLVSSRSFPSGSSDALPPGPKRRGRSPEGAPKRMPGRPQAVLPSFVDGPEESYEELVRTALSLRVDPVVGLRAETDCNRFATDFINHHMPLPDGGHWAVPAYPATGVAGHAAYMAQRADKLSGAAGRSRRLARALDSLLLATSSQGSSNASRRRAAALLLRLEALRAALGGHSASPLSPVLPAIRKALLGLI